MVTGRAAMPLAAVLACAAAGFTLFHDTGQIGSTRLNGFGCICHGALPSDSVIVAITGPSSVPAGAKETFRISVTGGPAVGAGFNVAALNGTLGVSDPETQLLIGELTHTTPRVVQNDSASWEFTYTAPLTPGNDTLYSVANSVNFNLDPGGDAWNFGADFIVSVHADSGTSVAGEIPPREHGLLANYPNPFNPTTTLSFRVESLGRVVLTVHDVRGRQVAKLVDADLQPGDHRYGWDASEFPTGVYYGYLQIGPRSGAPGRSEAPESRQTTETGRVQTRAMLLVR